jgi:7-carboxy-7-deazaguanine synthase
MKYPLSNPGVFRTIQGEGALLGTPMTFVRLAGCSIGCPGCDTNYRKAETKTAADIAAQVSPGWVWIYYGKP